jgi:glycosyltransferase involved in cell wall biosynthesis
VSVPRRSAEPRHVLYFNTWSTAHGGSSTSLIDIVTGLDRTRFTPTVVCPEPGDLPTRLEAHGVPVVIHPISRLSRQNIAKFVREVPYYVGFLRRERVALVHGNVAPSRRSLLQATSFCRIPYIQHVRNPIETVSGLFGYRLANRIITNSDDVAKPFRADPALASKTVTIYNAVDLSRYDDDTDQRVAIGAGSRPIVGFVGQIVPRKGVATLIRAMPLILRRSPEAWLVIVGCAPPGEAEYEADCRALVRELGLSDAVKWVGYRTDVPTWMRTFDVFALPTRSEPFGKVVIEAMAGGCPVVASRVGGIPEIINDADLGTLIPFDDPEALAEAVTAYLTDPLRRSHVSAAASENVRKRFGLQEMVSRLQRLYEEVLVSSTP